MDRTATYTYLGRMILAAGAATLAIALVPRASERTEVGAAAIALHEPLRVAPPPPIVARQDVPAAPATKDISLVFTANGAAWIDLGAIETLPKRHGKLVLAEDDYVTSAIAPLAEAQVPAAHAAWLGKKVVVDGTCTARVTAIAVVSRLTGDPSYAGVESANEKWTAAAVMESGSKYVAGKLDNCAGGTYARSANLAPIVVPAVIDDQPLAAAALAALKASPDVQAGAAEWTEYQQKGRWYDDEYTQTSVRVVRHPTTGVIWVSAHLYYGGGCGAPNLNAWGLYRVDADGTLVRAKTSLGELTEIQMLVDLDNDGQLEVIGRPWLGTERAVQTSDGTSLGALSLPYFFCPC